MRVLITGGKGMLGRTLVRALTDHETAVADLPEVDITSASLLEECLDHVRPDAVVHCAAMTAVDACETQWDKAYKINAVGSANVAAACARRRVRCVAVSTDYVFSGHLERPYHEWDATGPQTVYGASKLAGEEAVRTHCPDHAILRIAWLYGAGGPSFVHTMMGLGAQEGSALRVVDDQIGNPTSTDAVAGAVRRLLQHPVVGTFHGTCEGEGTWFDFACEIFRLCRFERGIEPCTTAEFPRPAPRPANSRLDKTAFRLHGFDPMPDWRDALARFLKEYPNG